MIRHFVLVGSMAALVAACSVPVTIQAAGKAAVDRASKPSRSAAPASTAPSTSPSPSPSEPLAIAPSPSAPVEVNNPFGFPSAISPEAPASVIATGGGNLIGQAGGNLIGQAGGNLIGQAGGNYAVLQTPPAPSLQDILPQNLSAYIFATEVVERILQRPELKTLKPGVYATAKSDFPLLTGQDVTGRLQIRADHALLELWMGKEPKPEAQIASVRFTSATKGKAIFHGLMSPSKPYLNLDYDLTTGVGQADGHYTSLSGEKINAHWEFRKKSGDPNGVTFVVKSASAAFKPSAPEEAGNFGLTAHAIADDSAAVVFGIKDAMTNHQFTFIPRDGVLSTNAPNKPHDFYLDKDGHDLAAAAAPEALQKVVPVEADIFSPFPQMPDSAYDPTTDPRYKFDQ